MLVPYAPFHYRTFFYRYHTQRKVTRINQ